MIDSKQSSPVYVYAVEGIDGAAHWLKMREIPLIGDTIIIQNGENDRVFVVKERGQIAGAKKLSCGWVRLEDGRDPSVAPGSDVYRFMEKFRQIKP